MCGGRSCSVRAMFSVTGKIFEIYEFSRMVSVTSTISFDRLVWKSDYDISKSRDKIISRRPVRIVWRNGFGVSMRSECEVCTSVARKIRDEDWRCEQFLCCCNISSSLFRQMVLTAFPTQIYRSNKHKLVRLPSLFFIIFFSFDCMPLFSFQLKAFGT